MMINTQIITLSGTITNAGTSFAGSPVPSLAVFGGAAELAGEVVKANGRLDSHGEKEPLSRVVGDEDGEVDVAALPLPLTLAVRCSKQRQALEMDKGEKGAM